MIMRQRPHTWKFKNFGLFSWPKMEKWEDSNFFDLRFKVITLKIWKFHKFLPSMTCSGQKLPVNIQDMHIFVRKKNFYLSFIIRLLNGSKRATRSNFQTRPRILKIKWTPNKNLPKKSMFNTLRGIFLFMLIWEHVRCDRLWFGWNFYQTCSRVFWSCVH
jgi:hypothetical protein